MARSTSRCRGDDDGRRCHADLPLRHGHLADGGVQPAGTQHAHLSLGDYTGFRHALLQALPGEAALSQVVDGRLQQIWRPTGEGDLALQLVEWTAYLGDILTFYCERGAIQAFLGTADQPESVNRLIQLLGYRPRPAIGATGTVAALLSSNKPATLPQGFQI